MTEFLSDLDEEVKRAKLKSTQAGWKEKEQAGKNLLNIVLKRGRVRRNIDVMHRRMGEAAEQAEKARVGTGGKGSSGD